MGRPRKIIEPVEPVEKRRYPQILDPQHKLVADMNLSGTPMAVGSIYQDEPSIWIQTDEAYEPTYISIVEAKMLIAVLQAAIGEATG